MGDEDVAVEPLDSGRELCPAIVSTVATVKDVDPDALEPLYTAIDPDALRDLIEPQSSHGERVTFEWADCEITVSGQRVVTRLEPADGTNSGHE
jgi:hypothetical protein